MSDGYKNVCKTMFLRQLYIFLWSLLAVIPMMVFAGLTVFFAARGASELGALCCCMMLLLMIPAMIPAIVKSLEYSMIPYLLAEHPEMSTEQAFAASKYLTDGHKGHLFVLELSFIGWILLGMLCCGIGVIFVMPYILASEAEAYHCLCSLKYPPNPNEPTDEPKPTTEQPPMTDSAENTEDMENSNEL